MRLKSRARQLAAAGLGFVVLSASGPAGASGTGQPGGAEPAAGDWAFELGGGAVYGPTYEGSDSFEASAFPHASIGYRNRLSLSFGDGLVWRPYDDGRVSVDLGLGYEFGRDQDDDDVLEGLGDINGGAVATLRVEYAYGAVTPGLAIQQDLSGDREGLAITADISYEQALFGGPAFATVKSSLTWADDNYMQTQFGISAAQSARSVRGLAAYDAGAGFKDAGVTVAVGYPIWDAVTLMGFAGYSRLLGDAADSPLVEDEGDPNQFSAGLTLVYGF